MNIFVFILLLIAFLGLLDKIMNNKLGLVDSFDKGIQSMGTLAISMMGFYCIAVTFVNQNVDLIFDFSKFLHFDPNIIVGCLLAPDLGGYSIVNSLSTSQELTLFAGLILTSTIGTVISFQLPLFFTALNKEDIQPYIKGLIYGMIVVPFVLIPLGMYLHIKNLLILLLPVFLICMILVLGLTFLKKQTMKFLTCFGEFIRVLSLMFFCFVIIKVYNDDFSLTSMTLIQESLLIVLKCTMIVIGAMILCDLCLKYLSSIIDKMAKCLNVNNYSIIGLFLQMATSVAMFPIFSKMDTKGKIINGAFSVSGAYVIGAQLGFASSVTSSQGVMLYIITKLCAGVLAVFIAYIFQKKEKMINEAKIH